MSSEADYPNHRFDGAKDVPATTSDRASPSPASGELESLVERLLEPCRDYSGEMIVRESTPRYEIHCDILYDAASQLTAVAAERDALREALNKAASLIEVVAEDAQARGDTSTWAMADTMAKDFRATLSAGGGNG